MFLLKPNKISNSYTIFQKLKNTLCAIFFSENSYWMYTLMWMNSLTINFGLWVCIYEDISLIANEL